MFSSLHRRILVNGFGEARREARSDKVERPRTGVGFLEGGSQPSPTS